LIYKLCVINSDTCQTVRTVLDESNTDSGNINFLTDNPYEEERGLPGTSQKLRWLYRVTCVQHVPWCLKASDMLCMCITAGLCLCRKTALFTTHWICQVCDVPGCHTCTKVYLILPQMSGTLYRHMETIQLRFINQCFQVVYSLYATGC